MKLAKPPPPLEWHPAYRGTLWLLDWLNGGGPFASMDEVLVPVYRPGLRAIMLSDPAEPNPIIYHRMTRHKAAGPAPYVGDPFVYVWMVGVDELGRTIASDSWRKRL